MVEPRLPLIRNLDRERAGRICDLIDIPVLVTVGHPCAGKDTLYRKLVSLSSGYGKLRKAQYWTTRVFRKGEAQAREPGPIFKNDEEILREGQKYALWYGSRGKVYVFPPELFVIEGTPNLQLVHPDGLSELVKNGTIPNRLTVQLHVRDDKDLAQRVVKRLYMETQGTSHMFPQTYDIERGLSLLVGAKKQDVGRTKSPGPQHDTRFITAFEQLRSAQEGRPSPGGVSAWETVTVFS